MSPAHTDTDIALPHASLLAYFRNPAVTSEARDNGTFPEPKVKGFGARHFLHTRNSSVGSEDEESKCGFWSERSSLEDDVKISSDSTTTWSKKSVAKGALAFCCFWCAFSIVILGASGLYFFVDLALSHDGLVTGMSQWAVYRHPSYEVSQTHNILICRAPADAQSLQMKFCLQTPNRVAPGPQTWRYMASATIDDCTTGTIALIVSPEESWKLQPDDRLLLGDSIAQQGSHIQPRKPTTVEEKIRAYKLGDDLAEEGQLGR
jgi:hypothetical protein